MSDRRVVSLWLPCFATDRLTRPDAPLAEWRDLPLATIAATRGGLRLAGLNPAARGAGLRVDQTLAGARALLPGLKVAEATPAADLKALAGLAEWCGRYTPWTAVEGLAEGGGGGLWLDISGCAHLFGGERGLLDGLLERLARLGFAARAGLADTPGAAWAMARFADDPAAILPEGAARQWLSSFPVAALRLPADVLASLRRLGLRRVGDLAALPRAPLSARFGESVARRLDQMFGRLDEPISPRRPVSPHHARIAFAEPVGRGEDVVAALERLLGALCRRLERERAGARRLELVLWRVDGSLARVAVGTARPVRDPAHLARLFRERLDGLDAGFGIEAITLALPVVEPLAAGQLGWSGRPPPEADLGLLVDRLAGRLGSGGVAAFAPRARHLPEHAAVRVPPLSVVTGGWPRRPRPLRLLPRPEAIEAASPPDAAPQRFRWRRGTHEVARAEGPERIAAEWWHGPAPAPPELLRDYWRVEDAEGRRFWLFRDGRRWFLHGVFA